MWFRNARVFRFTKPFEITAEALEEKLQEDAFKPCGPQETSRQGWVSPMGKHSDLLVHSAGGYHLIALRKEEKLLPASVIKELVDEKAEMIEAEQHRKVRRKEKDELKEEVTLEMLPRAFSKNRRCYAYLAPADGVLVVDAGSSKQAEDLASTLRKSLGSLPVRPPAVEQAPAFTFTGWLNESIDLPVSIELGTECELKDTSEDGGVVRCKGLDLQGDEIRSHLDAGMQVTKLSVTWDDNLSFVLDEELGIRRLKFGDTLQEKLDDVDADDAAARFDAAFSLMTLELARLIPGLLEALGGEDRSAIVEES
ncbi:MULTISPECIES: recombination-associated protein RdgC [Marinobacter]|jgi:recombination associated protein RdgC|uniref:Recombination-associated protein RdgC n=1 Tax=Marinobacter salarius TaxID=1420917 RepID=A0ABY1FN36_9GAMM|nr:MULTISPECIES: recombination-associated protein RdgC [Marinobacter]KXJ42212.1 MAG: recombination-associated protein RdgC [Marinobacter sp. Hex_13]MAB51824.1 recombination-associated protein RdgC [Marinobacter sp.]MBJ7276961.1 recombination-associated protein RdgC [Marinobacter salarius]MBL82577.1 recombination-associated protein RdgC [Marinobacter sp.]MCC4285749.1 recombination-associated protein RdgC [Marinobacter salarius]|tara:strand:- start:273 stop:1202 length:930 start_codon:yes stop_codon:yes gene_type:complete